MKSYSSFFFIGLVLLLSACDEPLEQVFVRTDIDHFWEAYDQITATSDTIEQARLLEELYLKKASPGLEALMEVRNYTPEEYLAAIKDHPKFWASVREQTMAVESHYPAIKANLRKLKKAYPSLQPAPIYFSIGAFRTNGTVHEGKVLMGSELALADEQAVIDELPEWRQPFFEASVPVDGLPLLCTHEYIHTQQQELQYYLLAMCMYEGVAEFISCLATDTPSTVPAIAFGKANEERVIRLFIQDMFSNSNTYNWMWGQNRNELEVRDLGYYVGYEISERHYNNATDKAAAIKELIEFDYSDEVALAQLVDATNLLPAPVATLESAYEASRPTVVEIGPFANGAQDVPASTKEITVRFSETLSGYHAGIDYGPDGEDLLPAMDPAGREWMPDSLGYKLAVDLEPGRKYQFTISSNFRTPIGTRLQPYVIEFHTVE